MGKIQLKFAKGIQPPAKLGTVILKPTSEGFMSYGQNVEVNNDEYGQSVLTPGPALNTLTGNSNLTGVPFIRAFYGSSVGYLWYAEGLLGATNIINKIKDVLSGSVPSVDSSGILTVTHSGHSSVVVQDMVFRSPSAGTVEIYIVGKDATDQWLQRFDASSSSPSLTGAQLLTNSSGSYEHKLLTAKDNNIYIAHANLIDSLNPAHTYAAAVLDLEPNYGVSALAEWNNFMAIAASYDAPFTFDQRKQGTKSGIFLWNYTDPSFEKAPIVCPSRYISALVPEPDGNLLVFGGLDQGKTTLYEFTGYGYRVLYSYIGDMPRGRHSVDFDAEGRILWLTVDGYLCRYDKRTGTFDQLNTVSVSGQYGGILSKLLNTAGYEFVITGGLSGPTFFAKRVSFGSYVGDDDSEDIDTPLAISGLVQLPPKSIITDVEPIFQKGFQSGDKVEIRLYKNGNPSYTTLGTISFTNDGTVASKHIRSVQYNADNCCIGFAWKMTDNSTAAPGLIDAYLHYNTINSL
jgi:hypothetical protein